MPVPTESRITSLLVQLSDQLFAEVEAALAFEVEFDSIQMAGPSMLPQRPEPSPDMQLWLAIGSLTSSKDLSIAGFESDPWWALFNLPVPGSPDRQQPEGIWQSFGGAGSVATFQGLVQNILKTAHLRVLLRGHRPERETVRHEIGSICDETLALGRGEFIRIPVIHYLSGVGLPAGTAIDVDGSTLLAIDEPRWGLVLDRREVLDVETAGRTGCLLVEYHPVWLLGRSATDELRRCMLALEEPPEVVAPEGTIKPRSSIRDLQVAFALSGRGNVSQSRPRYMSTRHLNFLSGRSLNFRDASTPLIPRQIGDPELKNVVSTLKRLKTNDTTKLALALDRYRSATTNRSNPIDRIIDAAIGLESLFGDSAFVNTSIAVGLSNLLGTTYEERKELYESSKRLYGKRSKIVHGKKLKPNENPELIADELLELLARSILGFLDEPKLLAMDTHDRTKELCIRNRT